MNGGGIMKNFYFVLDIYPCSIKFSQWIHVDFGIKEE
jgi:hypothetical protein